MVKFFNLKTVVLSVLMATAIMLPSVLKAQRTDGFFNYYYEDDVYGNRTMITIGGGGISPQGIGEAPLGSGLLVLAMAGAGYAVIRRRNSNKSRKTCRAYKNGAALFLAFAMLLGMTQCKKNLETINSASSNKVHITLRVEDDSKVVIDTAGTITPDFATVKFENGDIMYVGYNKAYVGYLTYDGTDFNGNIDIAQTVDDEPLYFYFIGGKGFAPTIENNVATLDISNQTEKYPIINFAHSVEVYPSPTGDYTARLLNKCAIVKFHVSKPIYNNETTGTSIMGMNNVVTVNFDHTAANTDDGFTYSMVNGGEITIPSNVGNVWAILLPQEQVTGTLAYSKDCATQNPLTIPAIEANDFRPDGIGLNLTHTFISVSATKKVRFSQGNLQYLGKTGEWRFAEHQYDFIGNGPSSGNSYQGNVEIEGYDYYNNSSSADAARDLFGWGTSGYNNIYPYLTSKYASYPSVSLVGDNANYDWGVYNSSNITNGNNYSWRVLTVDEWSYAVTRTKSVQTQPTLAENKTLQGAVTVNGVKGVMVLPDNWTGRFDYKFKYGNVGNYDNRTYTADEWALLEKLGCVFLPSVCHRSGTDLSTANSQGLYWSSTLSNGRGNDLEISNTGGLTCGASIRNVLYLGEYVRLVREI